MKKQKIISLHGSYFGNNYGDVLLLKMFTQWVREYDHAAIINYPMLKKNKIMDLPASTTRGLWNLLRSDALIFFGGGYFGEKPTHKQRWSIRNFYRHAIVALLAIVFRIPYAIIGVEFGPVSVAWFRNCIVFIAKHADYVVVRNRESLDFLNEYGVKDVKLSCDAVLALSDVVKPNTERMLNDRILLHITKYDNHVIAFVKAIIVVLKERNMSHVSLIEDVPRQFYWYHVDSIAKLFEEANISVNKYGYEGTDGVVERINNSGMVFTTKLHVGITGIALNKKVFSFYIHPKTLRFHKQVNNEKNCISINGIDDTIITKLRDFFKQDPYTLPEDVLSTARENKIILYRFLDERGLSTPSLPTIQPES